MQCKTVALYIRLSVEDGDLESGSKTESNSVGNQRMLLTEYIKARPEFQRCKVEEFCDDGYSGTNFDRPAFQRMMIQVKLKQIDCIIVKDLSRFGREYLDVSSYLELILPIFDVRFISINDYFDSNDYTGTTGGMELAFRNLINGMYSKDISLKVKSARKTRERKGEYLGGHPFYGYLRDPNDRHHLIVDEEVRNTIERIFQMSVDGMSTMNIAKILNAEQILCPVELKKSRGIGYSKKLAEEKALWLQATVRKIIKDERYTGKMVSNVRRTAIVGKNIMTNNDKKDWIVVAGTHEAIISDELYQEANAAMSGRLKTVNNNTNWKKSGNLFVCGCCGRKLLKSKGKIPYLYCPKSKYSDDKKCNEVRAGVYKIQQDVMKILNVMGKTLTDGAVIKSKKTVTDMSVLIRQLNTFEKSCQKKKLDKRYLYEAYKAGDLTKEEFIQKQSQQQLLIAELEQQLEQQRQIIQEERNRQEQETLIRDELKTIANLSEYQADAVGKLVEKIVVYEDGQIELIMKCQDAYKAVFQEKLVLTA